MANIEKKEEMKTVNTQLESDRKKIRVFLIIGSIILLIVGGVTTAGAFSDSPPVVSLLINGNALILVSIMGIIGIASRNKKSGLFYIVSGIASLLPAILICRFILSYGGESVVFVGILMPIVVAAILWVIGGMKRLQKTVQ